LNRKLLAVRADIAEKLVEIAKKKNVTLFSLVSEALEQMVKAEARGENLKKIVENHLALTAAREAGFTLIPESLWVALVEKARGEEGSMAAVWREAGEWLGHYFKTVEPEASPVSLAERLIRGILWSLSEFSISTGKDGSLTVKCVGFRCPKSYTRLLSSFIQGLMDALGYKIKSGEIARGIILMKFEKAREGES